MLIMKETFEISTIEISEDQKVCIKKYLNNIYFNTVINTRKRL